MITLNKWLTLSFAQQMGNIGAEIARARHWEGDSVHRDQCLERAFELLDLTLSDSRWHDRLGEVARLREVLADWYSGQHEYDVPTQVLEDYCISFSLR